MLNPPSNLTYHEPIFSDKTKKLIYKLNVALIKKINGLLARNLSSYFEKSHVTLGLCDMSYALLNHKVVDTGMLPLKNIFLHTALTAKKNAGASDIIAMAVCTEVINCLLKVSHVSKNLKEFKWTQEKIDNVVNEISTLSSITSLTKAKHIVSDIMHDDTLLELVCTANDMAGLGGQIIVDPKCTTTTGIELQKGCQFKCQVVPEYAVTTKLKKWEKHNVKCLIVDGIIEKVSEIHHILEEITSSKDPLVIFARGYSEEVIATLAINSLRKTIEVIPVAVKINNCSINMLKDIAVTCESDVISSLKGEIISSIKFGDISVIKKITVQPERITINNPNAAPGIKTQLHHLKMRKKEIEKNNHGNDESVIREKVNLINERIQSLSSNCAVISVGPEWGEKKGITLDRIDTAIKVFRETAEYGVINLHKVRMLLNKKRKDPVIMGLLKSFDKIEKACPIFPAKSILLGVRHALSSANLIEAASVMIVYNEK